MRSTENFLPGSQSGLKSELLEIRRHGLVLVCFAPPALAPSPSVLAEGTFVEVGGGDGITDSLSLYLEKAMGWRGLILEGNETQFVALRGSGRRANLTKVCMHTSAWK